MPLLTILTDLDKDPQPHLKAAKVGELVMVGRMLKGTAEGRSVVWVDIMLPDGSHVIAQTSMRLFLGAAAAFTGAEERDGLREDGPAEGGKN